MAILDADKEGFLRNDTTLIQTMGRAARHAEGHAIMYADTMTDSMKRAIAETDRRRNFQEEYNKKHNITPKSIERPLDEEYIGEPLEDEEQKYTKMSASMLSGKKLDALAVKGLEQEMKKAAKNLDFEKAAGLRDQIKKFSDER